jgi:Holliday junction DNA helicase RuvA
VIAKLKGIIDAYGDDCVVIDVGGVGYRVFCSTRTLAALPSPGEAAELHTEMLVSETAIRLVGFATPSERDWFQLLDNVQGVGTRVALAILSTLTASELANAIAVQDKAMVGRAPGVGPKLAQRIVSELKDKAPAFAAADPALVKLAGRIEREDGRGAAADAVSALVNLGYGQAQAGAAVAQAVAKADAGAGPETLIRLALKELAR